MKKGKSSGFDWLGAPPTYAEYYDQLNARYHQFYFKSAERLCQLAKLARGETAIEIGCGTGISTTVFWNAVAPEGKIIGIDLSASMIARAREKFPSDHVRFICGDGYQLLGLCQKLGVGSGIHCIVSSFTYYYMHEGRLDLERDIFSKLGRQGRWAFNITSATTPIKHGGKVYNTFSEIYRLALNAVLQRHGCSGRVEMLSESQQLSGADYETAILRDIGFSRVEVETWQLPLSPSEAYRVAIEGFIKYGSSTAMPRVLLALPVAERTSLMEVALRDCASELDATHEIPYILNVVATKP